GEDEPAGIGGGAGAGRDVGEQRQRADAYGGGAARAGDRPVRAVGPGRLGTLGRWASHVLQGHGLPGLLSSGLFSRGAKLHAPDHGRGSLAGGTREATMIPLSRVSLVI